MKLTFSGKTVLITGGNCRIGLTLAKKLIRLGLCPLMTYRNKNSRRKIESSLSGQLDQYTTGRLDLGDTTSIQALFKNEPKEIDYLVDLAQGDYEALVASASPGRIASYFTENITGRSELMRLAARTMLAKKFGVLLFISSAAAGMPAKGQGFYAASKLAAEALYKNIGLELGARGIRSLILRPGYIDAGRGSRFIDAGNKKTARTIPAGSILSPEEISDAVCFFLSDNARGFNSVALTMDCGLSAGKQYINH